MATIADVTTPHVQGVPDAASAPISSQFPVSPIAWKFLTTPFEGVIPDGVSRVLFGAVTPEGDYLEPTIGQIWPR